MLRRLKNKKEGGNFWKKKLMVCGEEVLAIESCSFGKKEREKVWYFKKKWEKRVITLKKSVKMLIHIPNRSESQICATSAQNAYLVQILWVPSLTGEYLKNCRKCKIF